MASYSDDKIWLLGGCFKDNPNGSPEHWEDVVFFFNSLLKLVHCGHFWRVPHNMSMKEIRECYAENFVGFPWGEVDNYPNCKELEDLLRMFFGEKSKNRISCWRYLASSKTKAG
jgi:hypothetical protein